MMNVYEIHRNGAHNEHAKVLKLMVSVILGKRICGAVAHRHAVLVTLQKMIVLLILQKGTVYTQMRPNVSIKVCFCC